MGYALAEAAAQRGWTVDLVSGPVSQVPPGEVTVHRVVSAAEMLAACEPLFAACDLFIAVAAVADHRPKVRVAEKEAKHAGDWNLELTPTVDILKTLAARKRPGQVVVGFAAETRDLEARARRKLEEKRLDWIVANDVGRPGVGMDAADNAVTLLGRDAAPRRFGPAPKTAVAAFILDQVTGKMPGRFCEPRTRG